MAARTPPAAAFVFLIWLGAQAPFFVPPQSGVDLLDSPEGNFLIFQNKREAFVAGAFSDRKKKFARKELIPHLKRNGIRRIHTLILTGQGHEKTGAWQELKRSFRVQEVCYMRGSAEDMRKIFKQESGGAKLCVLNKGFRGRFGEWEMRLREDAGEFFLSAQNGKRCLDYSIQQSGKNLKPGLKSEKAEECGGKKPAGGSCRGCRAESPAYQLTVPG